MFKLWIGQLLSVVSLSVIAHGTQAQEEVQKEVISCFNSLAQAARELDSKRYFQHFDFDKFTGLNSDGTNWNSIEDLLPLIRTGFAAVKEVTSLEFTNIKVSVIDNNTAILVNEYIQTMELKNAQRVRHCGGGSQVWSKQTGSWKLVSISASNKPSGCEF